jgi:hypothetical protein
MFSESSKPTLFFSYSEGLIKMILFQMIWVKCTGMEETILNIWTVYAQRSNSLLILTGTFCQTVVKRTHM